MEAFAHVPSMTFLKANRTFTGSNKGMRWKIYFDEEGIKAAVWPEPYCFECTPDEQKTFATFPEDTEGMHDAERWVDEQYYADVQKWVPLNQG